MVSFNVFIFVFLDLDLHLDLSTSIGELNQLQDTGIWASSVGYGHFSVSVCSDLGVS